MKLSINGIDPKSISLSRQAKAPAYIVKHPWSTQDSDLSDAEIAARENQRQSAENFKFKQPWDVPGDDILASFDRQVESLGTVVKHPWDMTDSVFEEQEKIKRSASSYEYAPLWKPIEMTEKQKEMIKNYRANEQCPFRREDNYVPEKNVTSKRMINKESKTIPPWSYGTQPGVPVTRNIKPPTPTSLWNVPPEMKKSRAFEPSGDPLLDNLREQLFSHGATGILSLSKKFKIMDDDGKGSLDIDEFRKAMRELQVVDLSDKAIRHIFRFFDQDGSGSISLDEFLVGVRGTLSPRRKQLVQQAFKILDVDGSGTITYDDIKDVYDTSSHPEVIEGTKTHQEVLNEFLKNFEKGSSPSAKFNPETEVTYEEFERYYANISCSIDDDDYFELMMRNAWHISGGEGWCGNTSSLRVLVTDSLGRQSVQEVKNDLGLRKDNKDAVDRRLRDQGLVGVSTADYKGDVTEKKVQRDFIKPKSLESHLLNRRGR